MPAPQQPAAQRHTPVLRERVVELLAPSLAKPGAVLIDATLGMGGHTEAVLSAGEQARVIGIDRDKEALALATERLAQYGSRFESAHAVYDDLEQVAREREVAAVDAIFFDLGVSSLQLDDTDRGFSYSHDAPLDMRMDQSRGVSAAEVVNTYPAGDLTRVLRDYGEERFATRVAKAIVRERDRRPFSSSQRLVEVVQSAIPMASQRTGGHPAKRTFQALRIEVNDELGVWRRAIAAAIALVRVGGRVVVLSYHSLEDRITKQAFAAGSSSSAPPGLPVELPQHSPYLRLLTRGAERASQHEQHVNPRSASARLRGAERIRATELSPEHTAKGIAHV